MAGVITALVFPIKLSCDTLRKVSQNSSVVITTESRCFQTGPAEHRTTARNRGITKQKFLNAVKNSQYSSKYRKNKNEHEIFSNSSYNVS